MDFLVNEMLIEVEKTYVKKNIDVLKNYVDVLKNYVDDCNSNDKQFSESE